MQTCRLISIYNGTFQGFSYDFVPSNKLSYFSTKTYVVGTHKNCRNETVLLSIKLNRLSKIKFTILRSKTVFI